MNKKILIVVSFIVVLIAGFIYFEFWDKENTEFTPQKGIVILSPKLNEEVSSPLKITGYVNGDGWAGFEGQVGSVKLLDKDNSEITQGLLSATSEWTTLPVNFEANLQFEVLRDENGTLLFKNENPSGLQEKDKTFSLPIKIKKSTSEIMYVGIYFNKKENDETFNLDCNNVGYVQRMVPRQEDIARTVLEELLKGPDQSEKESGWYSSIPSGVKIQNLSISEDGIARADFSKELEAPGGSCWVSAIRAQITQTLKQFPTVKDVIISINGETETILQP